MPIHADDLLANAWREGWTAAETLPAGRCASPGSPVR